MNLAPLRALALAGALILSVMHPAAAQLAPSGSVNANATASAGPMKATTPTAWLDRWCGSTNEMILRRSGGTWGCTTLAAGIATFLATPSSANLRSALTDESGSGAAYFQGGDLGTPSAGVLINATGLPIGSGISGLAAGIATFLATPSSANLRSALTDESGSGAAYFQGGDLGTPSAGVLTNATGLPIGGLAGLGGGVADFLADTTADDQVWVGSGASAGAWKTVPDCTDTAGNHLNYTQSTNTFSCGSSSSGGGAGVDTQTYLDIMLNAMTGSRNAALAQFHGYTFADSYGALTYVNTGAATALNSSVTGLLKPTVSAGSQISTSGLTKIGDMTSGGGLAAAFDGTASQNFAASANKGTSTSGYNNTVGVDWGVGISKTIGRFVLTAANDTAVQGAGGGATIKLQGSQNNSAWTDLYTTGTVLATASSTADISGGSLDVSTAYRYHRININGNGSNSISIAEVQLYDAVTDNLTVQSTSIAVPANPATCVVYGRVKHVDSATAGTDYNFYVSRDGGTTFSSAAAMTDYFTDPTDSAHVEYSASVDVSGQPSGANMQLKFVTANNKMVELRDWGFRCAP